MKQLSAFLFTALLTSAAGAQYCSPTFLNGCFNWNTQSVSIGTLDYIYDGLDCTASDFTGLSTTVYAGVAENMTVVNGVWCGVAVWVDYDNSGSFEDTENLYTVYVGADPSYPYDLTITVPASVPTGSYRMRVISPWGSDGTTVGANGYGPCGDYQYGSFQDFTLNVIGATGVAENGSNIAGLTLAPNPASDVVTLSSDAALERIALFSTDGRMVREEAFTNGTRKVDLDLGALPAGPYLVQTLSNGATRTARVMKQ